MKKNRLFLLATTVLVLFLLSSFTSVSAVGAGVNVTPDTIGLGDPISIFINPYTDLNACVVVAGPLAEDLTDLPGFHLHCLANNSDPVIPLTDGGEYTFIYPTPTEGSTYTWRHLLGGTEANTDSFGWYAVIVLLSDGPIEWEDLEDVLVPVNFHNIINYLMENYDTFIQFTVARVFAIPEIPFGTIAALTSPLLMLGCLKIIKRHRRD